METNGARAGSYGPGRLDTGKVGVGELTALLTIYTTTDIFFSYPARVAREGQTAAWMIPLVSGLLVVSAFLVIHLLMRRLPEHNLLELAERKLGRAVMLALLFVFTLFFLLQTAFTLREVTETVVTTVLPATPAVVVALLVLVVSLYFAYQGLEGLTRVSAILWGVFAIGLIALLALAAPWFDSRLLLPIAGRGWSAIVLYGALNTSMFPVVLMLSVLYGSVRNQRHFLRAGLVSAGVSAIVMSLVVLVFIGTFSSAVTGTVPFPMYQIARLIYVGRFVQRLESIFIFLWTSAALVKLGLALWFSGYLYATAFRMPVYRPLLFALAVIVFILGFLPPNLHSVQQLDANYLERFGWIATIALPLVLACTTVLRWRAGTARDARRTEKGAGGA